MAVTLRGPAAVVAPPILTAVAQRGAGRGGTHDVDVQVAFAQRASVFVALGTLLATLALILGLVALNASSTGATDSTAVPWIVALLACAAVLGLLCVVQLRLWNQAWRRWVAGNPSQRLERVSWVLHVVSYPVVVVGLFAGLAASHDVGFAGSVSTFSTLALVPLVAAQVLGAVQHVRRDGPPGTIPTHLRRLSARVERSRRED